MKKILICISLIAIILILHSCSQNYELINNIELKFKRDAYEISNDGVITIFYGDNQNTAIVPVDYDVSERYADRINFYITDIKTAVCYSGIDGQSSVKVIFSDDKGQNWTSVDIPGTDDGFYLFRNVGFINKNDGWIVLGGDGWMGNQYNFIYQTYDGGETWVEIKNLNDVYTGYMTCAAFANVDTGIVCFRYSEEYLSYVYRTENKGETWEKVNIDLPAEYDGCRGTITSIDFYGKKGILYIDLYNDISNETVTITMETNDYGKTWHLSHV